MLHSLKDDQQDASENIIRTGVYIKKKTSYDCCQFKSADKFDIHFSINDVDEIFAVVKKSNIRQTMQYIYDRMMNLVAKQQPLGYYLSYTSSHINRKINFSKQAASIDEIQDDFNHFYSLLSARLGLNDSRYFVEGESNQGKISHEMRSNKL